MDYLHFFSPVRISRGQGHPVEEVDSVAEAMVFLRKWPTGRRGPVYQCALNCCSAAMSGQMSAEEARKAFTGFARITRLLDDDMALPVAGDTMAAAILAQDLVSNVVRGGSSFKDAPFNPSYFAPAAFRKFGSGFSAAVTEN